MLQKLGPALIGAVIGMLLFWGISKLVPAPAAGESDLPLVSVQIPAMTPIEPLPPPSELQSPAPLDRPDTSNLIVGIRGTDMRDEVVGTMVDRSPQQTKGVGISGPTGSVPSDNCLDHEVMPRVVIAPDYPYAARREGQQGQVEVEFTVGTDGSVSELAVVSAEPQQVFNRAALSAVQRWRFEPRTVACMPTPARVRQVLRFQLDASSDE